MGFFDKLKNKALNEFIDIIEWKDESTDTIVWKFPRYQDEIKSGAQLTVRESQVAVFVNEGQIADVYAPGRYQLTTENMPILTTLKGWKYGFDSPFKVDVYFVSTKIFLNQKWGSTNSIMLRDPEFGPMRVRAYGTFNFRVAQDPRDFLLKVVGTNSQFTTQSITQQLRNFVVTKFSDYVSESKIPALDMAANLNEFSSALQEALSQDFLGLGVELINFLVENISLPEKVEEALDKRTSMGILGNMQTYTQYQFAESLKSAAEHGGGSIGTDAMNMGMGLAMAQQMMQNSQGSTPTPTEPAGGAAQSQVVPPPLVGMAVSAVYYVAINGESQGPLTQNQVAQMIQSHQLEEHTLIWKQGEANWKVARAFEEFGALFSVTPPPLPNA